MGLAAARALAAALGLPAAPVVAAALVLAACGTMVLERSQEAARLPLTRAERTDYRETTRYAGVMSMLAALDSASDRLHVTRFGYSFEGRTLPLAVWGSPGGAEPEAVLATGKLRVFVLGNIHAGEVCGKEAALILLRRLVATEGAGAPTEGAGAPADGAAPTDRAAPTDGAAAAPAGASYAGWADSLVLLVAPIYNADGNERIRLDNRPLQLGPVGGMGTRTNAQSFDLNRDFTRLEAPETRSLVRALNRYDPHVLIDLHTTNGTIHAYHLTYSPPLHPNTAPAIDDMLRDRWLPAVTAAVRERAGWEFFHYGNVYEQPVPEDAAAPARAASADADSVRGWFTYDWRPRYGTNYVGLRNRFGILSEAYAYASFEDRIKATLLFTEEVFDWAYAHASTIRSTAAAADETSLVGRELAVRARFEPAPTSPDTVLLGAVEEEHHPFTGMRMLRRMDVTRPVRMPVYVAFAPAERERVPAAYLIPPGLDRVAALLHAHGVRAFRLTDSIRISGETFRVDSIRLAAEAFQGHHQRTVWGEWVEADWLAPEGTLVVPSEQPLGRLVFALLEPRAADGVVAWNVVDEALEAGRYPVRRSRALPEELGDSVNQGADDTPGS